MRNCHNSCCFDWGPSECVKRRHRDPSAPNKYTKKRKRSSANEAKIIFIYIYLNFDSKVTILIHPSVQLKQANKSLFSYLDKENGYGDSCPYSFHSANKPKKLFRIRGAMHLYELTHTRRNKIVSQHKVSYRAERVRRSFY
jgi:hypothetical protein